MLGSYVANANLPDVGMILPEDYTLILSRGLMIPKGARQKDAAGRLVDFLLTDEAQRILQRAGLVIGTEPAEIGLATSARRNIPLSPALLVAKDMNRRKLMLRFWSDTFIKPEMP